MEHVEFATGDTFESYDQFQKKLKEFEKKTFTKYYKKGSRSVEAAGKRLTKKTLKEELKYAELTFSCINSGKNFKPTGPFFFGGGGKKFVEI